VVIGVVLHTRGFSEWAADECCPPPPVSADMPVDRYSKDEFHRMYKFMADQGLWGAGADMRHSVCLAVLLLVAVPCDKVTGSS
jgi:hypothetical protein